MFRAIMLVSCGDLGARGLRPRDGGMGDPVGRAGHAGRQPPADERSVATARRRFHIVGIDLTGAVMVPGELKNWGLCRTCANSTCPGRSGIPAAATRTAPGIQGAGHLKNLEKLYFGWHFNAQINIRDTGLRDLLGLTEMKDFRCAQCRHHQSQSGAVRPNCAAWT